MIHSYLLIFICLLISFLIESLKVSRVSTSQFHQMISYRLSRIPGIAKMHIQTMNFHISKLFLVNSYHIHEYNSSTSSHINSSRIKEILPNSSFLTNLQSINDLINISKDEDNIKFADIVRKTRKGDMLSFSLKSTEYSQLLECIKSKDNTKALLLYHEAKEEGRLPIRVEVYNIMFSFLNVTTDLNIALELFYDMVEVGLMPPQSAFLALLRCYAAKGDIEISLQLLKQMKDLGIEMKLRNYEPVFDMYCKKGDLINAIHLVSHMQNNNIAIQSEQVATLFKSLYLNSQNQSDASNVLISLNECLREVSCSLLGLSFESITILAKEIQNQMSIKDPYVLVDSMDEYENRLNRDTNIVIPSSEKNDSSDTIEESKTSSKSKIKILFT